MNQSAEAEKEIKIPAHIPPFHIARIIGKR
jgi:hypothetical protein